MSLFKNGYQKILLALYTSLKQWQYYIGRTSNKDPQVRIKQHATGFYSAQWVKMHGFLEVVEILDAGLLTIDEANKKETKLTLECMKKYGFRNVRGGDYSYTGTYYKIGTKLVPDMYSPICNHIICIINCDYRVEVAPNNCIVHYGTHLRRVQEYAV